MTNNESPRGVQVRTGKVHRAVRRGAHLLPACGTGASGPAHVALSPTTDALSCGRCLAAREGAAARPAAASTFAATAAEVDAYVAPVTTSVRVVAERDGRRVERRADAGGVVWTCLVGEVVAMAYLTRRDALAWLG